MSFCAAAPCSERARSWVGDTTYGHSKTVIRKQHRHKIEKIFIIFAKVDGFQGDICEYRFDGGRELALDVP